MKKPTFGELAFSKKIYHSSKYKTNIKPLSQIYNRKKSSENNSKLKGSDLEPTDVKKVLKAINIDFEKHLIQPNGWFVIQNLRINAIDGRWVFVDNQSNVLSKGDLYDLVSLYLRNQKEGQLGSS